MKDWEIGIIILFLIGFSTGCGNKIQEDEVDQIILYKTGTESENEGEQIIDEEHYVQTFVEMINSKKKVEDKEIVPNYQLEIKEKNGENQQYLLYLQIQSPEGFAQLVGEDQVYKIDEEVLTELLTYGGFEELYENRIVPTVNLTYLKSEESNEIPPEEVQWNYQIIDKTWRGAKNQKNEDREPIRINIDTGEVPVNLSFSAEPDVIKTAAFQDDKKIFEEKQTGEQLRIPEEEGSYLYRITALWNKSEEKDYYGSAVFVFEIIVDYPTEITLSTQIPFRDCNFVSTIYRIREGESIRIQ